MKSRCFRSFDYADDYAPVWFFFLFHLPIHRRRPEARPVELDLSGPFRIVPPGWAGKPWPVRKGNPDGGPGTEKGAPAPNERASPPTDPNAAGKPDEPGPGLGSASGEADGAEYALVALTARPYLLNGRELAETLRHYYPEAERRTGREAAVTLDLHVGERGEVSRADVVQSGGEAFDRAALQVAMFFKFSPARVGDKAVAVKLRQTIHFQLRG
jgi:TonB family protein